MKTKTIRRVAALLVMLCMLFAASVIQSGAVPDNKGTVKVKVDSSFEGIPLCLVEMGSYVDGKLVSDKLFADGGVDVEKALTVGDLMEEAEKGVKVAKENGLVGTLGRIDADGEVNFKDVEPEKLYLIYQLVGEEIVRIQPMILTMPIVGLDGKAEYNVNIDAKFVDSGNSDYLGAIVLVKTGDNDERLPGAEFSVWRKIYYTDASKLKEGAETGEDENGKFYWRSFGRTLTTDENGMISITDVPFADYRFIEVKAPKGYVLDSTPHVVTVAKHAVIEMVGNTYKNVSGTAAELTVRNVTETSKIESTPNESSPGGDASIGDVSIGDESIPDASVTPAPDDKKTELTGDDISKYITVGAIVGVSLVVIILFAALGFRKKNKEE